MDEFLENFNEFFYILELYKLLFWVDILQFFSLEILKTKGDWG